MKKSIILVTSVIFIACSSAFGQQEKKQENVQERKVVKYESKPTLKEKKENKVQKPQEKQVRRKTHVKRVENPETVKLKKELINKKAEERKSAKTKSTSKELKEQD